MQIGRSIFRGPAEVVQCRYHRTTHRVADDQHQGSSVLFHGKFHAADLRWRDHVSGNANNEKITESLVENDFQRNP